MSGITVRTLSSPSDVLRFIKFQWVPYDGNPCFVPPLIMDRKKLLDRKNNPFYKHARMELFMAERDGRPVGRIAAVVNDNHNKEHNENIGFFGFFESLNDQSVANALFDAARAWLKKEGVNAVRGPASPSVNDEYGLLVDGFNRPPTILMPYNPPYYETLIGTYGFERIKDLYAYEVRSEKVFTEKLNRVSDLVRQRTGVTIRTIRVKEIEQEIQVIRELYTRGWEGNWGEVPMTEEEFQYVAADIKQVIDPRVVIIAEIKGKPVGFGLSLPDLNQVLIKNRRGWLLPGAIRLLLFKRKINYVRIMILGVLPEYRNTGIGGVLFHETGKRSVACGYMAGEASWVLEDNVMMNRGAELMLADKVKTYRLFQMPL